ncbi:MAG: DUF1896 domain-containing protein [Muribaculum sp.]|nr:DUF1896 domain-containing protein [Muribaculum sp.]
MELDYFKLYLQNYLREHGFDDDVLFSDVVEDNADSANTTFANMRKAGYSYDGANELALKDLFIGIGSSQNEVSADYLEDWFRDRVMYDGFDSFNEWVEKLAKEDPIWKPYRIEEGIGLDEEMVETHKNEIIYEIDQFLNSHGL